VFSEIAYLSVVGPIHDISVGLCTTILRDTTPVASGICEDIMGRHPTRRIPKLAFTKTRGIGWHANYRDSQSGMPRKYRFGMVDREKASALYNAWLVEHLKGAPHQSRSEADGKPAEAKEQAGSAAKVMPGSLLYVSSNYLYFEEKRTRKPGEPRRSGTISPSVLAEHKFDVRDFLKFINKRYGPGSASTLSVLDLKMPDVEAYNAELVEAGFEHQIAGTREYVDQRLHQRHRLLRGVELVARVMPVHHVRGRELGHRREALRQDICLFMPASDVPLR
jgi:hypothetical protein